MNPPPPDQSRRSRSTLYLISKCMYASFPKQKLTTVKINLYLASFPNQKSLVKITPVPHQSHRSRSTLYLISKCMYASFPKQKSTVKINPLPDHRSQRSRSILYLISKCMYCVIPQAEVNGQDQSST
ncbi:hypothetical protein RRG08_046670 [Elysia crispata]|uniref:Uncharacterized protein n=1 Tax=Elysia crispata TaxID=231223 RepID=A0AAE1DPS8_9GAST|nr:hypothetical protein RRG08_046670 [Elysia crispata]